MEIDDEFEFTEEDLILIKTVKESGILEDDPLTAEPFSILEMVDLTSEVSNKSRMLFEFWMSYAKKNKDYEAATVAWLIKHAHHFMIKKFIKTMKDSGADVVVIEGKEHRFDLGRKIINDFLNTRKN